MNDFNVSSPQLAIELGLSKEHKELGRYVEEKVFGTAVDWFHSAKLIKQIDIINVKKALEENHPVPKFKAEKVRRRREPIVMSVDYDAGQHYE